MAQIKNLIARWDAAWPSPMIISRQYDNGQFRIDLMNYPEPEVIVDEQTEQMEILSYYLIVWMKETEDGEYQEMSPIMLPGPYWIVPNQYTQLVQDIRFQFCVQSDSTDYEAHSAIFTGRIVDSIEHDGTAIDVIPVEMFDAYKAYIQEIAMAAGAVVIDDDLDMPGAAADAKATGDAITALNERLGDLSNLNTTDKTDLVSAINEAASTGGGGGQPIPVTLASQMDTEQEDALYLYIGNEEGYEYGYIYAYQNGAFAPTTLYGRGQNGADGADGADGQDGVDGADGQDGFSPVATVETTSTGVRISITDKNGTTSADVQNGTATDAQVAAWLDDHPEATTTVEDGSITEAKLDSALAAKVNDSGQYKTANPTIVTLTPAVTLTETRIVSGAPQTNASYNTYLFAFSDFPTGITALLSTFTSGPSYYGGYVESDGTYTYTNVGVDPYAPGVSTTYDGFYISTNKTMTFTYYASIPVVTRYGYPHPTHKGFRSIEHDDIVFGLGSSDAGAYFRISGFENDNAYIIDLGNVAPTAFYEKTTAQKTHPAYLNLTGKQYLFGNLAKASMQFEIRQGQQLANLRALCQRGIYLWELLDIDELVAARSNIPNICLIHAGNWMDQVLLCMAQGWSGIECDVRTTSDGVCVLSHDATISGLTIASSTYADLVAANPSVTTVDEMMQSIGRFRGWIDFHWQAVDDATKLTHIQKAIGYKCANVIYYQGSNGTYIGDNIPIADFWKTGACHVIGHGANDLDHPNTHLNINNGINWNLLELGSGVTITYANLTTTYANRNIVVAYYHTPCLYQS